MISIQSHFGYIFDICDIWKNYKIYFYYIILTIRA